MKEYISLLYDQLDDFSTELNELRDLMASEERDDRLIVNKITKLIKAYPANPSLIGEIVKFLQLCNDEQVVDSYSLNDVAKLFERSATIFKDDIEINIEYCHFIDKIQDEEKNAGLFYNEFAERILQRVKDKV